MREYDFEQLAIERHRRKNRPITTALLQRGKPHVDAYCSQPIRVDTPTCYTYNVEQNM